MQALKPKENVVSKQQSDEMLRALSKNGGILAAKATALSTRLEAAENYLDQLPGKSEVSASHGDDDYLTIERSSLGRWRLVYYESTEHGTQKHLVTEASVPVKVWAAQLLPQLFERLSETIANRLELVDKGLSALDNLPFAADDGRKSK